MSKQRKAPTSRRAGNGQPKDGGVTGTYKYDEKAGRVVKISDRIPSITSRGGDEGAGESGDVGPCGRSECGGGTCAQSSEDWE